MRKFNEGFTLLEVMTAIALTGLVLVGIMQIVPSMLKVGTKVEVITKATFLAEKKAEEIRSLIFSTNVSYGYVKNYTQGSTPFPSPDSLYKFTISDDAGANIKVLNVTVWNDDNGDGAIGSNEHAVRFDSKVARR